MEKSDTTKSDFSDIEVEIQPPSEPDEEEEEEEKMDENILLGVNKFIGKLINLWNLADSDGTRKTAKFSVG